MYWRPSPPDAGYHEPTRGDTAAELERPGRERAADGTVTLLLAQPAEMTAAIARLDRVVDEAIASHSGVRPVEQGEGDTFVAAFARASHAVACALQLQRAPLEPIRLRIGVHTAKFSCAMTPTTSARRSTARTLTRPGPRSPDRVDRHRKRFGHRSTTRRRVARRPRHAHSAGSAAARARHAAVPSRPSRRLPAAANTKSRCVAPASTAADPIHRAQLRDQRNTRDPGCKPIGHVDQGRRCGQDSAGGASRYRAG